VDAVSQGDVHISLVNTSNRDLLERCLASLPGACEGITWRATVVDNASSDGSAELVHERFPWASIVESEVREGFSANHNKVIVPLLADRSARYVLVLNEDTELAPGSVTALVRWGDRDPRAGAVGPQIRGADGQHEQSYFTFPTVLSEVRNTLLPGSPHRREPVAEGWLNGSCVLVSVDALAEIGPLDEGFFIFYEDTDLGRRLADAGRRSSLCAEASIVHLGHRTVSKPGSLMEQQLLRSRYLYFCKHHSRSTAEIMSALVRGALVLRAAKALVGGLAAGDREERRFGRWLIQLAGYSPRRPLRHEGVASGGAAS
jgi:GT2 family glycosyltransferase